MTIFQNLGLIHNFIVGKYHKSNKPHIRPSLSKHHPDKLLFCSFTLVKYKYKLETKTAITNRNLLIFSFHKW